MLEPSFLIGGVAENFGTCFQLRPTRTFIIEGDEYDTAFFDKGPKFLHYFPDALILTHVEFDHADIYADLEAVKIAFLRAPISYAQTRHARSPQIPPRDAGSRGDGAVRQR